MSDQDADDISTINPTLDSGDGGAAAAVPPVDTPVVDTPVVATTPEPTEAEAVPSETPVIEPTVTEEPTPAVDAPTTDSATSTDKPASLEDAELLSLKEEAINELAPLLDQLDQSPEEKFKTTMMMIQATDNASLIKGAHETALKITDEKVRAQALLDVVNEINYFTQAKD